MSQCLLILKVPVCRLRVLKNGYSISLILLNLYSGTVVPVQWEACTVQNFTTWIYGV